MAAKKRHVNKSKRRTSNPAKGTRRYLGSRQAGSLSKSLRRGRRRSNPVNTATIAEGFKLGVSGMVIGFAQPMVRGLVSRFLPTGPLGSAALTLGTAYGLGALANFTPYTRSWKRPIELAGWTIVAAQLVSSYVLPYVNQVSGLNLGGSAGASGLGRTRRRGMRDLVTLPQGSYDPYFGSMPTLNTAPPVQTVVPANGSQAATLKDLLTMRALPGVQAY